MQDVPDYIRRCAVVDGRVVVYIEVGVSLNAERSICRPHNIVMHIQFLAGDIQSNRIPVHVVEPVMMHFRVSLRLRRKIHSRDIRIVASPIKHVIIGYFRIQRLHLAQVRQNPDRVRRVVEERIPGDSIIAIHICQKCPALKRGMPIVFHEYTVVDRYVGTGHFERRVSGAREQTMIKRWHSRAIQVIAMARTGLSSGQ